MGEIADDLIDSMFDDFPDDFPDEYDEDYQNPFYRPKVKTCNRCGVSGLHWQDTSKGWRLFDAAGIMHTCTPPPPEPRHWKIGDRMGETEETSFIIADMRLVEVDASQHIFDLEYYDEDGKLQGSQRFTTVPEE